MPIFREIANRSILCKAKPFFYKKHYLSPLCYLLVKCTYYSRICSHALNYLRNEVLVAWYEEIEKNAVIDRPPARNSGI